MINRAGFPTAVALSPNKPTVVNLVQGVAKVPAGFETVKEALFGPGNVTFISGTGKKVVVNVNWAFLKTGKLTSPR
jgi:hypothetical protein